MLWPIDRIPSGATTLGQSGHGSNVNEGVLCIPQSSIITGALLSDCLVSHSGHSDFLIHCSKTEWETQQITELSGKFIITTFKNLVWLRWVL